MQQIKLFKGVENNLTELEGEVNRWLADGRANVQAMFGNIAPQSKSADQGARGLTKSEFPPSDVLLILLYEKR